MAVKLPAKFKDLEPLAQKWSLATQNLRQKIRREATPEELKTFYDTMLPRLEEALNLSDQHPLGKMPEDVANLFYMALSMAEVAPHIELYGGRPDVPYSFEETRFVALHGDKVG